MTVLSPIAPPGLFSEPHNRSDCFLVKGDERRHAIAQIIRHHYSHGFPSGKSHIFCAGCALIAFSIPANPNLGRFILGYDGLVWELSRLWAPDGHPRNLLSRAIAASTSELQKIESVDALVSFADPNVGHQGGVYRAASWVYTGQSAESRYYRGPDGQVVARRKFHSGSGAGLRKSQIISMGYEELKRPGKYRFVKGLTQRAKRAIRKRFQSEAQP